VTPARTLALACALACGLSVTPASAAAATTLRVGYVGTPLAPGLGGATAAARFAAGAVAGDGANGAPFLLAGLARGDASLVRNAAYRGRSGVVDRIAITRYDDAAAAFADLQRARLDALLDAPASLLDAARRDARLRAFTPDLVGTLTVAFEPCVDPALRCAHPSDLVVRDALGLAVDRAAIAAALGTPLVRGVGGAADVADARRLLARAGYVCPADGLCERGGAPAALTLVASPTGDAARALPLVVAAARRAGIAVRVGAASTGPRDGVVAVVGGTLATAEHAVPLVRRERLDLVRRDTWRGFGAAGGREPLAPGPAALAALRPGALATPAARGPWLVGLALVAAATVTLAASRRRRRREQGAPRERTLPAA